MKYLKSFIESVDLDLEAFNIKLVIDILEEDYKLSFKTLNDSIRHQFWVFEYSNRPISLKIAKARPLNSNFWSDYKNYIVIAFLDLDIKNVSDFYKSLKFGRDDGIYIEMGKRDYEDISSDVFTAIENLKGLVDENNL